MKFRIESKSAKWPQLYWAAAVGALLFATCLSAAAQDEEATERRRSEDPLTYPLEAEEEVTEKDAKARHPAAAAGPLETREKELEAQQAILKQRLRQLEARRESFEQEQAHNKHQMETARKQMQMMQQQLQQQMQQQGFRPGLPENAETRIFHLRYSKARELIEVVDNIVGNSGIRLGADQRSNSLVVSADEKTVEIVEALLQQLDRPAGQDKPEASSDTLQLKIVWLLDGVEGKEPDAEFVSPAVVAELRKLGFKDARVVCQHVSLLTGGDSENPAKFRFDVPVLIGSGIWQFGGQGVVRSAPRDRFAVEFSLVVTQKKNPQISLIEGAINTPLDHYTVMGTTSFVAAGADWDPGVVGAFDDVRQHPSAFVVSLDRARDFPVEEKGKTESMEAGP